MWGATNRRAGGRPWQINFNPRAPCGARLLYGQASVAGCIISIHAPRVGRDCGLSSPALPSPYFNPRAPCGARRRCRTWSGTATNFNPRAPCGARHKGLLLNIKAKHFNPRAPCGARLLYGQASVAGCIISIHAPRVGRDNCKGSCGQCVDISIHAPRVGRDHVCDIIVSEGASFQSTRPVWGATFLRRCTILRTPNFNPRAPCGARRRPCRPDDGGKDFNPRAPCGARPSKSALRCITGEFQSTRPVWGATLWSQMMIWSCNNFNPRAPCGARRPFMFRPFFPIRFQSTRPVWGATYQYSACAVPCQVFQSTRPVWGATA